MKILIAKTIDEKRVAIPFKHIVSIEEVSPSITNIVTIGNNYHRCKGAFSDYAKLLDSNLI